jgi:hypothetical protein
MATGAPLSNFVLALSKAQGAVRPVAADLTGRTPAAAQSKENPMRKIALVTLACLCLAGAVPALAADTMMLDKGKSIMIEPDGSMTMLPAMKTPVDPEMVKASKPFTTCTIIMKGDDGKLYSVEDMKMKDGKMVCDAMKAM